MVAYGERERERETEERVKGGFLWWSLAFHGGCRWLPLAACGLYGCGWVFGSGYGGLCSEGEEISCVVRRKTRGYGYGGL